ncbi:glutamine synthetase family protein [Nocardioides mangrovi]|uniref:Glutamine synthetase family protein n=1 Tax=Nocardioides mangrovi TaxID=2874580 RepID=A0ABS7UH16_9ACTN|nr:glutamine synthetase family protein [Nocardioides mangrovi]MBZ5739918.1 glutamine synthetase family protein [Nocardioides mangrovi]
MSDLPVDLVLVGASIVDMSGGSRAKYVPAGRLANFRAAGLGASPSWSVFTADGGIAFTPELGVVGDLRIRMDPAAPRVVAPGIGWLPGDLCDQEGRPTTMCARSLLRRTTERARDAGLAATVGAELECTLLDADGGHASGGGWAPYGLSSSLDRAAFLVDLATAAERAGLALEQVHMEYGHDQLEVSLSPADPVRAADDVILGRVVIGRAAARHGLRVSFSPVPFAGEAGNGAHLHLSLRSADGPVLSGGAGHHGLTDVGSAAIAGVLDALPGLLGVYAGSAVSAARLQPGNWAGAALCWGLENREAAVRLVAAGPGSVHGANVELKVVDPSANPYLAVAAFLGSALRGIELGLPLPEEVGVHPSDSDRELVALPAGQAAALDALEDSAVAAELLGAPVVAGVLAVRRHEVAAYADRPLAETAEALRFAWSC